MNVEFTDRVPRFDTGIDNIEPGEVFRGAGTDFLATDDGGAVSLSRGIVYRAAFFEGEGVEVIPAVDVMVVIKR